MHVVSEGMESYVVSLRVRVWARWQVKREQTVANATNMVEATSYPL